MKNTHDIKTKIKRLKRFRNIFITSTSYILPILSAIVTLVIVLVAVNTPLSEEKQLEISEKQDVLESGVANLSRIEDTIIEIKNSQIIAKHKVYDYEIQVVYDENYRLASSELIDKRPYTGIKGWIGGLLLGFAIGGGCWAVLYIVVDFIIDIRVDGLFKRGERQKIKNKIS